MLSVMRAANYSVFTTKQLINFDEVESYMCIFAWFGYSRFLIDFWLTQLSVVIRIIFSIFIRRQAGERPRRFPHNNFSSVYRIFTKLGHMIPFWKGKNPIYFGVIRSKVKVTVTINRIFDNRVVSAQ